MLSFALLMVGNLSFLKADDVIIDDYDYDDYYDYDDDAYYYSPGYYGSYYNRPYYGGPVSTAVADTGTLAGDAAAAPFAFLGL